MGQNRNPQNHVQQERELKNEKEKGAPQGTKGETRGSTPPHGGNQQQGNADRQKAAVKGVGDQKSTA